MTFGSILFERGDSEGNSEAPECLGDLNLDQVIDAITAGKEEYGLRSFFYAPLLTPAAIAYRHEVMRDLEDKELFAGFERFAQAMRTRREYMGLAERLGNRYQRERWFLEAVEIYCGAVAGLDALLAETELHARGLARLREYLRHYAASERLQALAAETQRVKAALGTARYCLAIKENTIKVRRYEDEADYTAEVEATFARFKEGTARDYRATFASAPEMNHVEYQIINHVALLFPEVFRTLDDYCERNRHYLDAVIARCEREVQFYMAVLEYMAIFRRRGLAVCYPRVVTDEQEVFCRGATTWRWPTSCVCRSSR